MTTAAAPTQKSGMQQDTDQWVARAHQTVNDPSGITNPTGTTEWSTGFWSCFQPMNLCALTCCCPCITFGKTHHRLNKDPGLAGYNTVNASCLGWWGLSCFGLACIPTLLQRQDVRKRGQPQQELSGNFVTDFLKACCCTCCDLMQQEKEAEHLLSTETTQVHMQQPPVLAQGMSYAPH